jgi:long-chain fatty acid transport protein
MTRPFQGSDLTLHRQQKVIVLHSSRVHWRHAVGLAITVLIMVAASVRPVPAAGIALREGSADGMANAFAGGTAKGYNASTVLSNPAGMARLDRNEIELSLSFVAPHTSFSGSNTVGLGSATLGSDGGNPLEPIVLPGAFGVWSASPDLKFGVALSSPFGQRVSYSQDFLGRYQSLVSSVSDLQISLAAGYRINQHLSIGGGPVINIISARLTQAINLGPLSSRVGDPIADFGGSGVGAGFALGMLYEFDETFRIGIAYRSRIGQSISGTQSVGIPAPLLLASPSTAALLSASAGSASTRITLPDNLSIGFYKQIDERWAIMADLQWTNWSLVDAVAITPANGSAPTVLRENWRDTWFGAVGASFRVTDTVLLQAGVGYDLSPVTDGNRTTRVPDSNRFLLGGGATYSLSAGVDLQFAVLQVFSAAAKIDNSASATAGTIRGSYHTHATAVSVGMAARF